MIPVDVLRSPNKRPNLLMGPEVPWEISARRFPKRGDTLYNEDGSIFKEGLWVRNPVVNGVTYYNCQYSTINPYHNGQRLEVVRLTVGGVEYTEVFAIWQCDATPGTFYWDAVANRVYVHEAINLPFHKVFIFDASVGPSGNWKDETDDSRSATTADITMEGAVDDIAALGMPYSKFRYIKMVFSTPPVGGTISHNIWDGAADINITADIEPISGSVQLTSATNILRYKDTLSWLDPDGKLNLWQRHNTFGEETAAEPTGKPLLFWWKILVTSARSTAGTGTQFFVSPVLEESIVVAWLEEPIANKAIHIGGKWYQGRIITNSDNMSLKISSENSDAFQKAMIATTVTGDGGNVAIANADGKFDDFYGEQEGNAMPMGGMCPMKIGYDTPTYKMPIEEYQDLRAPMIEGVGWTDRPLTLMLMNQTMKMDIEVLQTFLSVSDYPKMTPDLEGHPVPVYFGNTEVLGEPDEKDDDHEAKGARGLKGFLIGPGQPLGSGFEKRKHKFGAQILNPETGFLHGWGTVAQIMEFKAGRWVDVPTSKYTLREGNTVVVFDEGYSTSGEIRRRGQGIVDDPLGTFTGVPNNPITAPHHVARFLLTCMCKYRKSEQYLPSFIDLGDTIDGVDGELSIPAIYYDTVSVYVGDGSETVRQVNKRLMNGIWGVMQPNNSGKMQISIRRTTPQNDSTVLWRHQTSNYKVILDTKFMFSNVILKYRQFPASGARNSTDTSQVDLLTKKNLASNTKSTFYAANNFAEAYMGLNKPAIFETYMTDPEQANALRTELQRYFGRGVKQYILDDNYGQAIGMLLGEDILINRERSLGGKQKEKQTWLITTDRKHDTHQVSAELLDSAVSS